MIITTKIEEKAMENDRRCGKEPVPERLDEVLNEVQLLELHQVEEFGWSLQFIRRSLFQDVIPVVYSEPHHVFPN